MGFIGDDVRKARDRESEHARLEMEDKNRRAIAAFCASSNIRRIVDEVRGEVSREYRRSGSVNYVRVRWEVDIFVGRSDRCTQELLRALRSVEPATSRVEFQKETYNLSSGIDVHFSPPLK